MNTVGRNYWAPILVTILLYAIDTILETASLLSMVVDLRAVCWLWYLVVRALECWSRNILRELLLTGESQRTSESHREPHRPSACGASWIQWHFHPKLFGVPVLDWSCSWTNEHAPGSTSLHMQKRSPSTSRMPGGGAEGAK